jgi:hypothetical protein
MTVFLTPSQPSVPPVSAPRQRSLQPVLARLATAFCAVLGLSAMATQEAAGNGLLLENGTYLYGESPVSDTVGAVYFVFQVEANQLVGAVYQPASSFDCVSGRVGADQLQLTIVDAYDQTERPYRVAFTQTETAIATSQGGAPMPQLAGLHPISTLSDLDYQLLATCSR